MKRLSAGAGVLALGLAAAPARAGDGYSQEMMAGIFAAVVVAPAVVLTFDIGNIVYIAQGPSRSVGRQVFSWGGIGLGAGGIVVSTLMITGATSAVGENPGLGGVLLLVSGTSAALGVWNLTLNRDPDPRRAWLLTPGVLADGAGGAAPGALLGGRF